MNSSKNFFKSRWNKDNFCTLMFFVCSVLSIFILGIFFEVKFGGAFVTILVVGFCVSRFNPVSCIKYEGKKKGKLPVFLNSQGQYLNNRLPKELLFSIIAMAFWSALGFVLKIKISKLEATALMLLMPTLYFILKNCPISIMYKKEAWTPKVHGIYPNTSQSIKTSDLHRYSKTASSASFERSFCSTYRSLPGNIFHKK